MRYYFPESPNLRWFRQKGDCRKVTQAAAVDISKDAPLSKQERQVAAAQQRRAEQAAAPRPGDGLLRFMDQMDAVHRWWNAPPASKQAAEAKSATTTGAKTNQKPIDKFDLQDVADTLDRLGFTLAATLLRKWFTSRAFRAQWKDSLSGTVPDYPADMVDITTLKHSELVQLQYIKNAFDRITAPEFLRSQPVQDALLKVLRRIPQGVSGVIVSSQYGEDAMLAMHRKYAFTSVTVGRRFPGYYSDIRTEDLFRSRDTADDVELAIGEFRWFLALERVSIYPNRTTRLMQVKSVAVYAMASYGFETPEGGTAYRGHWNKKYVSLVTNGDWVDAPVYIGNDVYARNAVLMAHHRYAISAVAREAQQGRRHAAVHQAAASLDADVGIYGAAGTHSYGYAVLGWSWIGWSVHTTDTSSPAKRWHLQCLRWSNKYRYCGYWFAWYFCRCISCCFTLAV
ncbi:DUF6402 family protein [Rhodoferax sp. GW822-FHT02A01]|uniref:DUF6402 family protein n=1 Tax=Rhodoferax sp. GW822-FHT02A01 TaxID=3141537 RepID=UPI00315DC5CE